MKTTQHYDYIVVGSGLFGSVFARRMTDAGYRCLVLEKRPHVGGNLYCETVHGIPVHRYGAHIFHTDNDRVWQFVNSYVTMNRYTNCPVANYRGKLYNLPFNMNTFYALWGVTTPEQARAEIERQRQAEGITEPRNLEEKALSLVGRDIYEKLIRGYTEKQWGRSAKELPAFIIGRLPLRFTYDNNYFNSKYQGIPVGGYNPLIEALLRDIEVITDTDYNLNRAKWNAMGDKVVYTGTIDSLYDYCYGNLEYRSLRFDTHVLDTDNYQGVAVMNYTDREPAYTRVIEHKHFDNAVSDKTVVTYEYPATWKQGDEPYYPVNDDKNDTLYRRYAALAAQDKSLILGGRLGLYRYFDMDRTIAEALQCADAELEQRVKN